MQPCGVGTGQPDFGTGLSTTCGEFHWRFGNGSGWSMDPVLNNSVRDLPHSIINSLQIMLVIARRKSHFSASKSLTSF